MIKQRVKFKVEEWLYYLSFLEYRFVVLSKGMQHVFNDKVKVLKTQERVFEI
jgi:hypothetical protein